ncbi:DUF2971 domain-containing protein [Nonlabens sp. Ci31]|uniref:DUF2971 domain-containing protein n=1 Tax=Nonlabens sp. Ci31 TaxID=2608253 RepID=UPI0014636682|nr:DUF2971 domain-containing protein [Nonlabens sp. Ci31]QJP34196.1 DUF2971 domain-containing protein [Nonlabens sp. Ci31]
MSENTVYHYTSLETLYNIINEASETHLTLRATHVDFLNDFTEHTIAVDLLKKALIKYDTGLNGRRSKDLATMLNDKRMSFFRISEFDEMYLHIISFSEHGDSLPMWNTYSNKSNGVALGFDKVKLKKFALSKGYKLESCVYDAKIYEDYLSQNIQKIHASINVSSYSIGFTSDLELSVLKEHYKYLPILKDKSYKYEEERRLIIPVKIKEKDTLKFHTTDTLLKPYREILIPFEYLTEIVLGPCLSSEKLSTALALFLGQKKKKLSREKNPEKIYLRKSECPYRNI